MSALDDALMHPANRPSPLVRALAALVNPGANLEGLQDGGGLILDFRPGHEEKNSASLSVSVGNRGTVFNHFSGDEVDGGTVGFVADCLGLAKSEAAKWLIDRAGMVDTPGERKGWKPTPKQAVGLEKVHEKLAQQGPVPREERTKALKGWEPVTTIDESAAAQEVQRRGLTPALLSGALVAFKWTGRKKLSGGKGVTYRLADHIHPDALLFEVRGPDGTPWAYKVRNAVLQDEKGKLNRYAYASKGGHSPAWCSPHFAARTRWLVVEGELNAVACWVMLVAAGQGDVLAVQGVASAQAQPHILGLTAGHEVFVFADPDDAGEKARERWAALFSETGATVRMLDGDLFGGGDLDACDVLGSGSATEWGGKLLEAMQRAPAWEPAQADESGEDQGDVWLSDWQAYGVRGGKICAITQKTNPDTKEEYESVEVLAEFTAFIAAEVTQEDGSGEAARVFEIEGTRPDGRPMNPAIVTVTAQEFNAMTWPTAKWGASGIVHAGNGKKDKARAAVQLLSQQRGVQERTVYQHTGWTKHAEHGHIYLSAGAVIGAGGGVNGVDVDLSGRLSAYSLPDPVRKDDGGARPVDEVRRAVRTSLDLLALAPDAVSVPVLGAVYRAVLGRADFVLWMTGETGRHKTAFMGLAQSHYGVRWGRKFLPDGWNSSANALESNAFRAKDTLFLVDDFKPSGNASERAKADGTVSRIIQGAADGAGRATLTADRRSRAGLFPRGLVMTSAEDLPRGHSNRARLVIVEVHRKLIDTPEKSAAYFDGESKAEEGVYALALAGFVQAVAGRFDRLHAGSSAHLARIRALSPYFAGEHGRTGDAAAEIAYGWECFLSFAVQVGAVDDVEALSLWDRVVAALAETAQGQGEHLAEADPTVRALSVLSGLLAQGRVYLEDLKDGGRPEAPDAVMCGWQRRVFIGEHGEEEESFATKPGAVLLGWTSATGGDTWGHFLPDALHEALQKAVQGQGGALLPDASKLWGDMRDRLYPARLMRCEVDGKRVRATSKATLPSGERKQLITLRLPLDILHETLGTAGTDTPSSPIGTLQSPVPTFTFFRGERPEADSDASCTGATDTEGRVGVESAGTWEVEV